MMIVMVNNNLISPLLNFVSLMSSSKSMKLRLFWGLHSVLHSIKLLESPIPTATATATASSQKAHFDDISGTKRGTIDPLVSKRPEKNSE